MIESLLLTSVHVNTFKQDNLLTNASGFFFEREGRLFLVTSRHVMVDEPSSHFPDRLLIELHTDPGNMAMSTGYSIPLYNYGSPAWRQGLDNAGIIDVAVIEIDRYALPASVVYQAFNSNHLPSPEQTVEIGSPLLVPGFPLGFHDTLHHIAVVRHAIVASSYGLRFEGQGYFLTDGRTHRGTSGAPVVTRIDDPGTENPNLPWLLLGIHSSRLDVGTRDLHLDEALGLNCAWYSDILITLTEA